MRLQKNDGGVSLTAYFEKMKAKSRESRDELGYKNELPTPATSWGELFKCYFINRKGTAFELLSAERRFLDKETSYILFKAFRYKQNNAGRWVFAGFCEISGLDSPREWSGYTQAFDALCWKKRIQSLNVPSDRYFRYVSRAAILMRHWKNTGEMPNSYAPRVEITNFNE